MFDIAIVGAGSAGCALANRLSASGTLKIALLEAGPEKHRSLKVRAPGLYQTLWRTPLDWAYSTEPQVHCNDRKHFWPRGKVTGGTSALNAVVYIRGNRANYDAWNLPGWRYDDVLPYFKKSEDNSRGASEFHGAGGPLAVSDDFAARNGVSRAFIEATAARCNVAITDDFNGAEQAGAGHYQLTTRNGLRVSTATAFLDPVRTRDNLTVITNAHATAVIVDGDRVTGVRYRDKRGEHVIDARETIVCGGAIGSPQLLLLSGIGPADELRAVGITPRHELAGVGKHLEDHLFAGTLHDAVRGSAPKIGYAQLVGWIARHVISNKGTLAGGPVEAGAFVRSRPDAPLPDVQFHFLPYGANSPTDVAQPTLTGRFASILPGLIYPRSHGEVRLRSADPFAPPSIDPRYFSDPADLEHLVDGVILAREIAATAPLAGLLGAERLPGPQVTTRDQLRDAVRAHCNTIFHPTGTCKMGTDLLAVVDPELRVHGLRGLRIVDASVMPRIIGGNTNAPTIMIAERAADLVLAAS